MSVDYYSKTNFTEHRFSPYSDNGGTTVGIAGDDFVIVGSDSRLSSDKYVIYSRNQTKCVSLTPTTLLASTGCWADVMTLRKVMDARLTLYSHEHRETMSTPAVAQLLSTMLYYRRFFPYYVSNTVAGFDNEGKGIVYSYDPVGHMEAEKFFASGSSSSIIQPLIDNQIGGNNMTQGQTKEITPDFAKQLIKDAFISAAERDIYCGDGCILYTITKEGITEDFHKLRMD